MRCFDPFGRDCGAPSAGRPCAGTGRADPRLPGTGQTHQRASMAIVPKCRPRTHFIRSCGGGAGCGWITNGTGCNGMVLGGWTI